MQELLTLVKNNEKTKNKFNLNVSLIETPNECGTVGCLIGNDMFERSFHHDIIDFGPLRTNMIPKRIMDYFFKNMWPTGLLMEVYGIESEKKFNWLFINPTHTTDQQGLPVFLGNPGIYTYATHLGNFPSPMPRNLSDHKAAINRVRKYIYWHLHRQEMLYDENGCIREEARREEGDRNVAAAVLAAI